MRDTFNKLAKLQQDNPDRYCDAEEYDEGFVCFMDILGFSDFSSKSQNFSIIRDLINSFVNSQINEEVNEDALKISIASDSVVMTIEKNNMFADLDFLIRKVMYFRRLVIQSVGTEIRAGITYGEYIHAGYKGQMYYGPAIVRSVQISEKVGDIACKYGASKGPAGIYLDSRLFEERKEHRLYKFEYERYLIDLDNGNYLLNPYVFEYYNKAEYFVALLSGNVEENITQYNYWKKYIDKERKILTSHLTNDVSHSSKYQIYNEILNEFEENEINKIDRKLLM